MHKKMPATTWLAWVHVFNYFTCLLDRGASEVRLLWYINSTMKTEAAKQRYSVYCISFHDLIAQLRKAKYENRLEQRIKWI